MAVEALRDIARQFQSAPGEGVLQADARLPPGSRSLFPIVDQQSPLPRLLVFALLVAAASLDTGPGHGRAHWLVLAVYGIGGIAVALAQLGRARAATVAWAALGLDAALASYALTEDLGLRGGDASPAIDMLGQLPALLLLLQTGRSLSLTRTLAFSGVAAAAWTAVVLVAVVSDRPSAFVQQHLFGLVAFLAACLFVVHGVRRLRFALASATRSEQERASLARFVPAGVGIDLVRRGRSSILEERSACLLAVDIRGFSNLTRSHRASCVVEWLLDVRAIVHGEVVRAGGIVDKYVGDGVLALFLDGTAEHRALAALTSAAAIRRELASWNRTRDHQGLPAVRLTFSFHAGEVLAGVFDDGLRAEFTVLGPAMNALSRIERRAKEDDLDLLASKRFARLLGANLPGGLVPSRLARRADDHDAPDVVSLTGNPADRGSRTPRMLGAEAYV